MLFRSSIARPTNALAYASTETSRLNRKTQGQDGVACSFLVRLFHPLQHAGLSRRTPREHSNRCTTGSIKEDVKRKSFSASWKPRKVSASSPLPLCGCLEAYRAYVGEM